jgi:hypothetical protein
MPILDAGSAQSVLASSDPNWFYSTLAQSAAAIVGLAGGFMAARLTTHRGEIARAREPLKAEFDELVATESALRSFVAGVREALVGFLDEVASKRAVEKGEHLGMSGLPSLSMRGNPSAGAGVLTKDHHDQLREFADVVERFHGVLAATTELKLAKMLRRGKELKAEGELWLDEDPVIPAFPSAYWEDLAFQRDYARQQWRAVLNRYDALMPKMNTFKSRLLPRTFFVLVVDLAVLLIVGTIIPASLLTARDATAKALLLAAFGACALVVAGVLAVEMLQIRTAADLSKNSF